MSIDCAFVLPLEISRAINYHELQILRAQTHQNHTMKLHVIESGNGKKTSAVGCERGFVCACVCVCWQSKACTIRIDAFANVCYKQLRLCFGYMLTRACLLACLLVCLVFSFRLVPSNEYAMHLTCVCVCSSSGKSTKNSENHICATLVRGDTQNQKKNKSKKRQEQK